MRHVGSQLINRGEHERAPTVPHSKTWAMWRVSLMSACLSIRPSLSLSVVVRSYVLPSFVRTSCRRSFVRLAVVRSYVLPYALLQTSLIMLQITECFLRQGKNDSIHGRNCGCSQDATNMPAMNLRVPVNGKVTQRLRDTNHQSIHQISYVPWNAASLRPGVRITRLQKRHSHTQDIATGCKLGMLVQVVWILTTSVIKSYSRAELKLWGYIYNSGGLGLVFSGDLVADLWEETEWAKWLISNWIFIIWISKPLPVFM